MPKPEPVDGFKFGVTLNYDGDPDSIRLLMRVDDHPLGNPKRKV
jgi:hypothetical protein